MLLDQPAHLDSTPGLYLWGNSAEIRVAHLAAEHRDDVRPKSLYYEVNEKGAEKI